MSQGDYRTPGQIARDVHDIPNSAIRVDVVAGGTSGTQYTEGDTDATITGTAILWEDSSDTLRAVSSAKPLPVSGSFASPLASTAVLTSLTSSASTQIVLALNTSRRGFILVNESTGTCYVAFAATASATAYTIVLNPGMTYQNESVMYTGVISAIWVPANGFLRITELST